MTREKNIEYWTNPLGERFRIINWPAKEKAEALVVIHHGLGEHAGRYDSWVEGVADLPVDIWAHDARGHGESVGKRGDADGYDGMARDFDAFLKMVLERTGHERVVVFGHSMGAAIVAHYAIANSPNPAITGMILSAPPFFVPRTLDVRFKIKLSRILSSLAPTFTVANGIHGERITSVPEEQAAYNDDPLLHPQISVRLGESLIDDSEAVLENAQKWRLPALVYQGSEDDVVDPIGGKQFADKVGTELVEYHAVQGRHELHHEHEKAREELFGHIKKWLTAHLAKEKAAA